MSLDLERGISTGQGRPSKKWAAAAETAERTWAHRASNHERERRVPRRGCKHLLVIVSNSERVGGSPGMLQLHVLVCCAELFTSRCGRLPQKEIPTLKRSRPCQGVQSRARATRTAGGSTSCWSCLSKFRTSGGGRSRKGTELHVLVYDFASRCKGPGKVQNCSCRSWCAISRHGANLS